MASFPLASISMIVHVHAPLQWCSVRAALHWDSVAAAVASERPVLARDSPADPRPSLPKKIGRAAVALVDYSFATLISLSVDEQRAVRVRAQRRGWARLGNRAVTGSAQRLVPQRSGNDADDLARG